MNFRPCSRAMKIFFSLKQGVFLLLLSLLLKTQLRSMHLPNRVCLGTVTNSIEGVFAQMGRDPLSLRYCQTLTLSPIFLPPTGQISLLPDPLFLDRPSLFLSRIQPDKPFVKFVLKEDIRLAIVGIGLIWLIFLSKFSLYFKHT